MSPGAAAAAAPRIEAVGIHKSFGSQEVLRGVSVRAGQGDVVTIIGGSGSGKSTFLRCVNLLEVPDAGSVAIDGEALRFDGRRASGGLSHRQLTRVRASLGMVFQNFCLWSHWTILENVAAAPIHVLKLPRKEARERARALLAQVGILEKADYYPVQLSGGQQQRAAIARALALEPKAILLDEPTSALDPELVAEVLKVIRDLAAGGTTMLLVTHELRFAREVASRVVFMQGGVVAEEGPPAQVLGTPLTEACARFVRSAFG